MTAESPAHDNGYTDAHLARAQALDQLIRLANGIADADDYGDMLGALRLVEISTENARAAIVREARAAGDSWQQIADALGVTRQAAHARYARRP